jgi:recombination protein RecT
MSESKALAPIESLKQTLSMQSVKDQFANCLAEGAPLFVASLIDVYGSDTNLQRCNPSLVIREALKAATLKLPINKNLGLAYIIPYKESRKDPAGNWSKVDVPQFQIGYRGFIQLAIRSGQYRYLNADCIYEGEEVHRDRLTGETTIQGTKKSAAVIGYFAFFETLNGFRKCLCWTRDEVAAHARRFSKSYEAKSSPWQTDFDAMAIKTVLKALLSKYGMLSIDMIRAMGDDDYDRKAQAVESEIQEHGNRQVLDAEWQEPSDTSPNGPDPNPMEAQPQQQGPAGGNGAGVAMEF